MVKIIELKNKIRVILEPIEYLKSTSIGIWIKIGSSFEEKYNNGISHVIEHMLFKGTNKRTAKQLADDISKLGGEVNAFTGKECTSYYAITIEENLFDAIDILSDMIINSKFDKIELEKEKKVIIEEINMYKDSAEDIVHEYLQKKVWNKQSIGYIISGSKKNVKSFKRKDIIQFKEKYYNPSNMVISIAGHFDEESTIKKLEECFGKLKNNYINFDKKIPIYNRCFCTKERDIEQAHMNITFEWITYNSKDKYCASIVNYILGSSDNSKLFQKIREELGLAYSVYSYDSTYENAGLFHIYAAMKPTYTEFTFNEIINIIKDFKKNKISQYELEQTKKQIRIDLLLENERPRNRMNSNAKLLLMKNEIYNFEDILNNLNNLTLEDVNNFIDSYLDVSKCSVCIVGNTNEINLKSLKKRWSKLSLE